MGTDGGADTYNQASTLDEKKRILVVDDEPDVTLTLKMILEETGLFDVDEYNDPEIALSNFKSGSYALLLLDFKMPKMNGYELYDKMKKIDDRVKVCFITAAFMGYEKAKDACVILKPVELTDLIEIVKAKVS